VSSDCRRFAFYAWFWGWGGSQWGYSRVTQHVWASTRTNEDHLRVTLSDFIKKIFICVQKMNEIQGLGQHEGE